MTGIVIEMHNVSINDEGMQEYIIEQTVVPQPTAEFSPGIPLLIVVIPATIIFITFFILWLRDNKPEIKKKLKRLKEKI